MEHQEVCESAKGWIDKIVREDRFSGIEVFCEDRHDGRVSWVFSFTPEKAITDGVEDAR